MIPTDFDQFGRTIDQIFSLDEVKAKLAQNRPLRIKYGADVTAPFLHIGHAVNLWMMRYLQEQGHKVIFLIGDFTTRIGDPTGKSQTRKIIPRETMEENAREFIRQAGMVLLTDPAVFEVRRNSEWFDRMPLGEFMSLLSAVTHARLIQRDMFQKRIENSQEIYLHEMLYPILQGYDSVVLESDVTIVGSDQLFNELMGRFYQEKAGQTPQVVVTTRITPGLDGVEKQSKSLGNYIALVDTPRDKFGKIMSIPDALIISYFEVYTLIHPDDIRNMSHDMAKGTLNPMEVKKRLAQAVVERYHGKDIAREELQWFTETFSRRITPDPVPEVHITSGVTVLEALQKCLPDSLNAALKHFVQEGAVRLNGTKLSAIGEPLTFSNGDILKVGKRKWFKLCTARIKG